MTWKTHKLITFTTVLALTGNVLWSALAAAGSVLPDALEFFLYGRDVPSWKHRRHTHVLFLWIGLAVIVFPLAYNSSAWAIVISLGTLSLHSWFARLREVTFSYQLMLVFLFWVLIGGALHCLEDALTGHIPLRDPRRKSFGVCLFKTRSVGERVVFLMGLGVLAFVIEWRFKF